MKKYISLEHAIRKAVAEQNYKKKALDESISPVDYDKPKEVPQAFFKPVHIQPRKGEDQIPAGGPVRSRRNYEKEKSSETMHPNLKNEETIDEVAPLAIPLIGKGISALAGAGAAYYAGKQVLQGNTGIDVLSKTNRYIQGLKKAIIAKPVTTKQEPATVSRETEKPAGVPSPVDVPAPTTATVTPRDIAADKPQTQQIPGAAVPVATGAKPEDKTQAQTTVPAAVAVPLAGAAAGAGAAAQTRAATKATAATKAAERTATAPSRPARGVPLPFGGSGGASDNSAEIFNRSHVPSRISIPHKRKKAHFEETRYDIKNVARPEDNRDEEIVGRPKSPKSKYTKQAEIIRKVIEEQKIIIKKDKEEKMGKNPLVDTEPKLKHHTLDQESAK